MSDVILPFKGNYPVTRPFGEGPDPVYANYPESKHPGTDWGLPANTPLIAAMDGVATIYNRDMSIKKGRGKEVSIANGNKDVNTCHMNRIDVTGGQFVKKGQQIGLSGNTGYVLPAPTILNPNAGAHLHAELLIDGKYIDLNKYVKEQNMEYPNKGDITNLWRRVYRREPNANDLAYWTKGTSNPHWSKGPVETWKQLGYELSNQADKTITNLEKAIDPKSVKLLAATRQFINENKD